MLKRVVFLITALSALIGGMIWLRMGFELSLMPTGNPKDQVYRSSQSFMPWFGCGIACIGVGLVGLYVSVKDAGRFVRWALIGTLLGCFIYLYGTISRISMNLSIQYEAAQPIGLLVTIAGLLFFSVSMLRSQLLPLWTRVLLLLSSVSLLIFNDQFITAWSSVPFGISWMGLSMYLFRRFAQASNPKFTKLNDGER
ncbi:hypothetical protein [Paenibacillus sedimenti]|uniref:hypothetical protein n=1 Tax=Paenibacillus sedimenti TaxID=2770274 RepID=UPI00165FDDA5|nr:hypothetical protein [Paenibacillus sedimenti]